MFSSSLVGFLMALGAAAWIYSKMMRRTGNNTKSSLTIAGITGLIIFVMVLVFLMTLDSYLGN